MLDRYYQYFLHDDLRDCLQLRSDRDVIGVDTQNILIKAFCQIFKTRAEGRNNTLLYQSRAEEIADAMEAIDDIASQMRSLMQEGRGADTACKLIVHFALSAKRRAATRGSDISNYEQATIFYDMSMQALLAHFEKRIGVLELINHGVKLVEYMAELREPLLKSCTLYQQRVQTALDLIHY